MLFARDKLPSEPPDHTAASGLNIRAMLFESGDLPRTEDSSPPGQPPFFSWLFSREDLPRKHSERQSNPSTPTRR